MSIPSSSFSAPGPASTVLPNGITLNPAPVPPPPAPAARDIGLGIYHRPPVFILRAGHGAGPRPGTKLPTPHPAPQSPGHNLRSRYAITRNDVSGVKYSPAKKD